MLLNFVVNKNIADDSDYYPDASLLSEDVIRKDKFYSDVIAYSIAIISSLLTSQVVICNLDYL